ncbi:double-strand break repair protein AddB [Chenggangzhangella methanolivorans]|uniref:Double-strand break repair protein AddB n=2 Tax=Chenggangzhangella methanolivorans TaxID=1437009 RepID=A0A9E6RAJ8_9HYPH|nr:double-strand break repair protein AddB [Chenggangzhangella methanolivorans]QZO01223.1 double-strand break repair protein AddB [Chenggangzhangella methanolivorans]
MPVDSPRANVLTIAPGAAFLPTLVAGLLDGALVPGFAPRHHPIALADATVFLPTRRAARALRDAFLEALDGRATLLPRIAPLGDVDEDADVVEPLEEAEGDLPSAAQPFARRLALARLVKAFAGALDRSVLRLRPEDGPLVPSTAADAIHLAGDLESLIDAIETEEVDARALDALIPGEHDQYWAITQAFLRVALARWPEHLAERGELDPSARRRLQIEAATRRVAASRGPVIAAGSTGSAPAVRRLMRAISTHPMGAVVLPGLDRDGLEDAAWRELVSGRGPGLYGHPQRGLAQLLETLEIRREDVRELGGAAAALGLRARLAADALRPAETTDAWATRRFSPADVAAALDGVSIVEAPTFRAEAAAIAVALREAVATPGKTAALVTPDRALAARVAAELERWSVLVDDSAGRPLASTPAGALLRLAAEAALAPTPAALLALLRAPACRLASEAPRAVDALDVAVFRAMWPATGLKGLRAALAALSSQPADAADDAPPRRRGVARRFGPDDLAAAASLVERLETALAPLAGVAAEAEAPLERLVGALSGAFEALAGTEGEDVEAVHETLDELRGGAAEADPIAPLAFPGVLEALLAGRALRPPRDRHPRLRILGPLEARLLSFDLVILGGLNEGVWPPVPQADPWINRPLRAALGLAPPERRIGLSAHDFSQGLGAPEVVLTRAAKVGGAPTIPARWLQRLAAVAAGPAHEAALARGRRLLAFAERLDDAEREPAPRPPEPRPPLAARPRRLSVTAVETWLRDPYSIYARHILRLEELQPVGPEPGPGDLGNVIHKALETFVKEAVPLDDPQALDRLLAFGVDAFGDLLERDDARTLWWPRFVAVADWALGFHRARAAQVTEVFVERDGAYRFETVGGRTFELTARADRIEAFADGTFSVLDYKTGAVPTAKQALAGFAPQLPLEGAILREGGFATVTHAGSPIGELSLIKLAGRDPAGETVELRSKELSPDAVAIEALARFKAVVNRFEDPREPYRSLSHPQFLRRPDGPYAHLARVKEWSATGGAAEGEAE